mgnify:CR=1 FL=1
MTLSISALCPESGQLGIAISSSSIAVGARCPWLLAGVGAVSSQNITLPALGPQILAGLEAGLTPQQALTQALGAPHVRTGADAAPYVTDWRKRYHGQALCVARPANTEEVAQVVKACAEAGVAVVPQGGNTGLVGGATPLAAPPSVILSLRRMNRVRRVDGASQTLTAEAGCTLQQVQQAAADAGWLYPLRMGSEGSCTVGGNLATNAGGTQVLRYGNARELCLGLEAVTPQGAIWHGCMACAKTTPATICATC